MRLKDTKLYRMQPRQSFEMLLQSNYWAALIQRIRDDVESINAHEYWRARTGNAGLRFEEAGQGYQISKSGDPGVIVKIKNGGSSIEVQREFDDSVYLPPEKFKHKEVLKLGTMGDSVILVTHEAEKLIVPQEAAKYMFWRSSWNL